MTEVVLVHGVGLDRHMWDPFVDALGRPCNTYDLIGLGDGPRPPGPYSLQQYADQLAERTANVSNGEPVDVVGFSLGALIAQRFAVDHPALLRRLVLVSGVYSRSAVERAAIVARVAEVRAGRYAATIEPALQRWFTPDFAAAHPEVVETVRDRMLANDPDTYAHAYDVFATGDAELVPLVAGIRAATLVVTGACDERSTPQMTYQLGDAIGKARAVVLPGLRHLVPLEAPDRLAALVSSFLTAPEDPNG